MLHNKRFYRFYSSNNRWKVFNIKLHTSDLYIKASHDISEKAYILLNEARNEIEQHIKENPDFLTSLEPLTEPAVSDIISEMYRASDAAGTGPMAAVAGAISEYVGKRLLPYTEEIVVENGGDIWMSINYPVYLGIYSDNIYFKDKLALKIDNAKTPCAVCTSSSKTGHSLSFGKADSVTVVALNGAYADAVATETCNRVKTRADMEKALEFALSVPFVKGCLIVFRDRIAALGDIELAPPEQHNRVV